MLHHASTTRGGRSPYREITSMLTVVELDMIQASASGFSYMVPVMVFTVLFKFFTGGNKKRHEVNQSSHLRPLPMWLI